MEHSKIEKQEYFANLRKQWKLAQEAVNEFTENEELCEEHRKALEIVPAMSPT
jgi:hypothetical protein